MRKKITLSLPKCWNELSEIQMRRMALLIYSGISGTKFDIRAYFILCNCFWWQFKKRAVARFVMSQVSLKEIKAFDIAYIYKSTDRTVFPEKIKAKSKIYYAPMNKLANLSVSEFSVADDLHIKFRETKNPEYLHYLAAALYSEKKQPREAFDKNNLPDKAKLFSKVPLSMLLSIELSYAGCKNHLAEKFTKAFPKSLRKNKIRKKYGFAKVVLQMAGGKFGNHEQTKATNIYTFLEEFEENLEK